MYRPSSNCHSAGVPVRNKKHSTLAVISPFTQGAQMELGNFPLGQKCVKKNNCLFSGSSIPPMGFGCRNCVATSIYSQLQPETSRILTMTIPIFFYPEALCICFFGQVCVQKWAEMADCLELLVLSAYWEFSSPPPSNLCAGNCVFSSVKFWKQSENKNVLCQNSALFPEFIG